MSVAQKDGIKAAEGISYDDLYRRWEQSNWEATAIDFAEDREGWAALTEMQRRSALWIYSMFFFGEDSVADNLSPYIDAAPKPEQKYFLATQQVDEARHAVFFHRFFSEVIGAGDSISSTLAYTEPQLNWGYRGVFDRLDRMADDLRRDRSLPNFARAIALYHMVVEATLAQPGQHYIEDYFASAGTMPGFSEGMANVSRDEQRHIGFGVKVLSECFAESEECKEAVAELLRELLPVLARRLLAAQLGPRVHPLLRLRARGHLRLRPALGADQVAGDGLPARGDGGRAADRSRRSTPEEVARRQLILLEAGVMGEPNGRPDSSPEIQALYFDIVARSRPHRRRQRLADDDPVALRRRRPLARADRQRLDRRQPRAGAGARPDDRDQLAGLDRGLDQGRQPAPGAAAAADPPARLAAPADPPRQGLPGAPQPPRLTPSPQRGENGGAWAAISVLAGLVNLRPVAPPA